MSGQYSCEFCSNYVYDEEYEEYACVVSMDEDDLAMLMQFKRQHVHIFHMVTNISLQESSRGEYESADL